METEHVAPMGLFFSSDPYYKYVARNGARFHRSGITKSSRLAGDLRRTAGGRQLRRGAGAMLFLSFGQPGLELLNSF